MSRVYIYRSLLLLLSTSLPVVAWQAARSTGQRSLAVTVEDAFIQKQFGAEFTVLRNLPAVSGDLNGDGIEDIVIPARAKSALIGEAEYNYKTIDPYTSFFGLGDPKISSEFASEDPQYRGFVLLVIHGAGQEAWRSATPKAKFVIINLPFRQIALRPLQVKKKKVVTAIYAEETGGDQMTSATYFDGKRYKYQPMGSSLQ
ncbi:MAG: hypothetical protein JO266_18575 [Acidobacteria bacterium]|nr:hypothetical protein [Acidobacteriota bacterium]MBV8893945.1 hypothetical protein [Acidobacteriota bacterium]